MSNTSVPSLADREQLKAYYKDYVKPCRDLDLQQASQMHPEVGALTLQNFAERDVIFGKLVRGEISWAQADEARKQLQATYAGKYASLGSRLNASLAASHAAEREQTRAGFQRFSDWALQQQKLENDRITSMNRSMTSVTCMRTGNIVTCN